jgi:hypothetical protein
VINLLPDNTENYLGNEAALVETLGMTYIHIPVDFDRFVDCMQSTSTQKGWVHCAANARVSAFIYRYRRNVLGDNVQSARQALNTIWQPFGVWKTFIDYPSG